VPLIPQQQAPLGTAPAAQHLAYARAPQPLSPFYHMDQQQLLPLQQQAAQQLPQQQAQLAGQPPWDPEQLKLLQLQGPLSLLAEAGRAQGRPANFRLPPLVHAVAMAAPSSPDPSTSSAVDTRLTSLFAVAAAGDPTQPGRVLQLGALQPYGFQGAASPGQVQSPAGVAALAAFDGAARRTAAKDDGTVHAAPDCNMADGDGQSAARDTAGVGAAAVEEGALKAERLARAREQARRRKAKKVGGLRRACMNTLCSTSVLSACKGTVCSNVGKAARQSTAVLASSDAPAPAALGTRCLHCQALEQLLCSLGITLTAARLHGAGLAVHTCSPLCLSRSLSWHARSCLPLRPPGPPRGALGYN
jgi:hypothetical protein